MNWAEQRARLLTKAPPAEPIDRAPFEPGPPHLVTNGDGTWSLTPYAWAHCVSCGAELAEGEWMNCPPCRQKIDETAMPWEGR